MFKEVFQISKQIVNGVRLDEALSPEEIARMRAELATPDIRPHDFDVTIEGWITRLELWGKLDIVHVDPEFRVKKRVTTKEFIDRVTDSNLLKLIGQFKIEKTKFNQVVMYRDYVGMGGRRYREKFIITIKLRPELRRAIRGW